MSWEQVASLARESRVSIGAHGCSHTPLTALTDEQVGSELRRSRELIGAAIERPVISVAYPNGNFDEAVIKQTSDAGYLLGFTTDKGPVSTNDHPLKLTRINVHEGATRTMPEFLCAILLIFQRLRRSTPPLAHARTHNR
jgi:peptidoglycan/xylan/chitin deacetylase (PgdA/CDA1 family)